MIDPPPPAPPWSRPALPALRLTRLWNRFVRWEMTIEGIPVVQAATAAFEDGLAEAISLETGNYTSENSTVLVNIP